MGGGEGRWGRQMGEVCAAGQEVVGDCGGQDGDDGVGPLFEVADRLSA